MKKIILLAVLSLTFLLGNVSLVSAGKVATEGNLALIADGGLVAVGVYEDLPEGCFAGGTLLDPLGVEIAPEDLIDATDVVIDGDYAVVTIDPENPLIVTTIVTVDISSCLSVTEELDPLACVSTVNIEEGELTIPCVEINKEMNTVVMERRGNSDNWEVSFLGANPNFGGDDDDDHDDDDDDHDDDDDDHDDDDG